jgi:leader peptidase (prepilin peptidase)/N-methyltransferase
MAVWLFVLGLCVGSFLNVCIARIPAERSVVSPPSACPGCLVPIHWYDNIPVISYILLRGRCRSCGGRISPVYPLVELAGGAIFLSLFLRHSLSAEMARGAIFLCCMLVLFFIDLRHMLLPNVITLPAAAVGVLFSAVHASPVFLLDAITAALAGAGTLLAVMGLYYGIRRRHGMGMGDVKMMLTIGAFLGLKGMFLTLVVSSLVGGLAGIALLISGKKFDYPLPFGSFLAPAAAFTYFVGTAPIDWYMALLR